MSRVAVSFLLSPTNGFCWRVLFFLVACLASAPLHVPSVVHSFSISPTSPRRRQTTTNPNILLYNSPLISPEDELDLVRFQRRQQELQKARKGERPPHPSLEPRQVVSSLLAELQSAPHFFEHDPLKPRPHPGVSILWQASADEWRQTMAAMVGAVNATNSGGQEENIPDNKAALEEQWIVPALGRFLARPHQQFAILMGLEDANYWIDFPTDVIEWSDEEAWLECRLRSSKTDELLVVLGWTLSRPHAEDAWYIQSFDWQDFRNAYRPGIGREEWERICG